MPQLARESRYLGQNIGRGSQVPTKRNIFRHPGGCTRLGKKWTDWKYIHPWIEHRFSNYLADKDNAMKIISTTKSKTVRKHKREVNRTASDMANCQNPNPTSTQPNLTQVWVLHENDFSRPSPTHTNSKSVISQLLLARF